MNPESIISMYVIDNVFIIPLLMLFIEILKKHSSLDKNIIPFISIFIGIIVGIAFFSNGDFKIGILHGFSIGLSSVGLYEGTDKAFYYIDNFRKEDEK